MTALVVMIAPPGAGKSTWLRDRFSRTQVVNLDELRGRVCDDPHNQDATRDAVALRDMLLAARCRRRLLTVVDATNVRADVRAKLLDHAYANAMFTVAVVLDVPLEVCLARNAGRAVPVPPTVVHRMWQQLTDSIEPTGGVYGFSQTLRIGPDGQRLELVGRTPPEFDRAPWSGPWPPLERNNP